jgi:hypothetical protein
VETIYRLFSCEKVGWGKRIKANVGKVGSLILPNDSGRFLQRIFGTPADFVKFSSWRLGSYNNKKGAD